MYAVDAGRSLMPTLFLFWFTDLVSPATQLPTSIWLCLLLKRVLNSASAKDLNVAWDVIEDLNFVRSSFNEFSKTFQFEAFGDAQLTSSGLAGGPRNWECGTRPRFGRYLTFWAKTFWALQTLFESFASWNLNSFVGTSFGHWRVSVGPVGALGQALSRVQHSCWLSMVGLGQFQPQHLAALAWLPERAQKICKNVWKKKHVATKPPGALFRGPSGSHVQWWGHDSGGAKKLSEKESCSWLSWLSSYRLIV